MIDACQVHLSSFIKNSKKSAKIMDLPLDQSIEIFSPTPSSQVFRHLFSFYSFEPWLISIDCIVY